MMTHLNSHEQQRQAHKVGAFRTIPDSTPALVAPNEPPLTGPYPGASGPGPGLHDFQIREHPHCAALETAFPSHTQHTLCYLARGACTVEGRFIGQPYRGCWQAGEFLVTPAYADQWMRVWGDFDLIQVSLVLSVPAQKAQNTQEVTLGSTVLCFVPPTRHPWVDCLLPALVEAAHADSTHSPLYAPVLAHMLAETLVRSYAEASKPSTPAPSGLAPWRLRRVLAHLQAHLTTELRLPDLASIAGLSPYHFCRLFKQSTGLTPHQYLLRERVRRAQGLLRNPDVSIATVSYELGFPDQSHFTNVFRKFVGMTPKQFRQRELR